MIGCGDVTEKKSAPAYQQIEGFDLTAVMGRSEDKVKDYARRHRIPNWYTDAQELITNPEIDAIYMATPPHARLEYALAVARTGKPCCIEKPLSSSYAESRKIVDIFNQYNVPLFVAYYRRSLPLFLDIRAKLQAETIGEVRSVDWQLHRPPSTTDLEKTYNWRTDRAIAPGGYFDDLASHGLDLFAFYFGEYTKVSGQAINQQKLYSAPDSIAACWTHTSGVTGTGHWNFGSAFHKERAVIRGENGTIEFSVFGEKPYKIRTNTGTEAIQLPNPNPIQLPFVFDIRQHLCERHTHTSTGETALHTAWVMDEITK